MSLIDAAGWDDLCPQKEERKTPEQKETVYIVLEGDDCEGAEICGVYAKKEDAIKYIDKRIKKNEIGWIRKSLEEARTCYKHNGRIHQGCHSIEVVEYEIH